MSGSWLQGAKEVTLENGKVYLLAKNGYLYLRSGGISLHRVTYEKFHGPIPKDWIVQHCDGNKLNNKPENLVALPPQLFKEFCIYRSFVGKALTHEYAKVWVARSWKDRGETKDGKPRETPPGKKTLPTWTRLLGRKHDDQKP